jgi:hypothetical protein
LPLKRSPSGIPDRDHLRTFEGGGFAAAAPCFEFGIPGGDGAVPDFIGIRSEHLFLYFPRGAANVRKLGEFIDALKDVRSSDSRD